MAFTYNFNDRYEDGLKNAQALDFSDMADNIEYSIFGTPMVFPLKVRPKRWEGISPDIWKKFDWWLLPIEPLISIYGSNAVTKRKVSKLPLGGKNGVGGVTERVKTNDYSIVIEGLMTNPDKEIFPRADFLKMIELCKAPCAIEVLCPIFEILEISHIAIESFDFPFTKGAENQAYRINAISDDEIPGDETGGLFIPVTDHP